MKTDNTDIAAAKRKIRQAVLKERDALDRKERERADLLFTERILGHQWFYRSEYFLCFVSCGSEIGTRELIREGLRAGKKVYVPKVTDGGSPEGGGPKMRFFRIEGTEELSPGYKGIPEPGGDSEEYPYSEETAGRTLVLMPGAVFDRYGNRIGYGKGFYDRFLGEKPLLQVRTIAAGYRCQLLEKIPAEERDIRPCQIICM